MPRSKGAAETGQPVVTMDSSNIIKVTVKTLKQKEQFEVAQSSTIQEFKKEVAKRFKASPDLLVLIFAGKVLKDQDTLSQHGVHSGVNIHVVIRSQQKPQDGLADQERATALMRPPSRSNSNLFYLGSTGLDLNTINNNTFLLGFLLGVTGVLLLGLDSTDLLDLVNSIQEEEVPLHSLVREMQTALVRDVLDNADVVRDLLMSSPQMQQLAEENPEICHILTHPQTIREMLEASSSPAVMQEMIRNHDVAMNNLESIPGGFSALEQLYKEVQEPILDAVQMGNSPFAPQDSNPALTGARLPAHTENRRPLPNPWAPRSNGVSGNAGDCDGQFTISSTGDSFTSLSLGPAAGPVVPNSGQVQTMVEQLTGDPELMHSLGSALTNPDSPAQVLLNGAEIPSDGNSPLEDQQVQQLPPELEDAEISSLLRNPRALQALLQIQLGLQTLSTEVPDFILSLQDPSVQLDLESMDDSSQSSESEDGGDFKSDGEQGEHRMEMDEEMPQARFGRQMEQLSAMGFQDQSANLEALIDADGDVSAAVEILAKAPSSDKIP
ncbi:ubiquilin-1 [Columba livia]|uniref:Ubiquilin-1 n=1 Tax=Columba livia TaxID=8932 RepID=A0A2I0LPJ9_COLLI|nr:ubiquilin-1 [Columba livia]